MIQLCETKIVLPFKLLFESMLEEDIFPEDWNVIPVHKKDSKNLIKIINQSVFLLSIVKSLKGLYLILYLITLCKANFLQYLNQV